MKFLKFFLISLLWVTTTLADSLPWKEAPQNGFIEHDSQSLEAKFLKTRFDNSQTSSYEAENLRNLNISDFINLDKVSEESLRKARKLFQAGKVVVVDSVVGNATRLGNPPGGKGVVEIADGISFLDAKIIRLAIESKFLGSPIAQILWSSDENLAAVEDSLKTLQARMERNQYLSISIKHALNQYLEGKNITLMAQSSLLPVINETGDLSADRMRNLGAGELIPTIYRSGADKSVGLTSDSIVVFSNIDFDVSYLEVVAGNIDAGQPDLMQVHVPTTASGGSAYWVNDEAGWRIIPLEGIEVPSEVLENSNTLNTNTVIMRGNAIKPEYYDNLPLPFEKKVYGDQTYYLPKLSLSDIGKHPNVKTSVAIGSVDQYFFGGSKNLEKLEKQGPSEIKKRIRSWNRRLKDGFEVYMERVHLDRSHYNTKSCADLLTSIFKAS